jgi:hypothetical protein
MFYGLWIFVFSQTAILVINFIYLFIYLLLVVENMKSIAELVENITKDVVVENMKSMAELVQNITKDLKKSTSGLDDLKSVTDRINSKCEDGLSDMSEKIAGLEKNIGELKPITINKRRLCSNLDCLFIRFICCSCCCFHLVHGFGNIRNNCIAGR